MQLDTHVEWCARCVAARLPVGASAYFDVCIGVHAMRVTLFGPEKQGAAPTASISMWPMDKTLIYVTSTHRTTLTEMFEDVMGPMPMYVDDPSAFFSKEVVLHVTDGFLMPHLTTFLSNRGCVFRRITLS